MKSVEQQNYCDGDDVALLGERGGRLPTWVVASGGG